MLGLIHDDLVAMIAMQGTCAMLQSLILTQKKWASDQFSNLLALSAFGFHFWKRARNRLSLRKWEGIRNEVLRVFRFQDKLVSLGKSSWGVAEFQVYWDKEEQYIKTRCLKTAEHGTKCERLRDLTQVKNVE
jgi:hypothetical protein